MSKFCGSSKVGNRTRGIFRAVLSAAAVALLVLVVGCSDDGDDGDSGESGSTGGGGDTYESVTIGSQTWMKRNLNIETANSWCYDDNPDNCAKYGRLYTWAAARTACPSGWHLPTDAEWTTLTDNVGGESTAGTKLKSATGWCNECEEYIYIPGTDDYGFSALPGGYDNNGIYGIGSVGVWWSATEYGDNAWTRGMNLDIEHVYRLDGVKSIGFSVRCVRN